MACLPDWLSVSPPLLLCSRLPSASSGMRQLTALKIGLLGPMPLEEEEVVVVV